MRLTTSRLLLLLFVGWAVGAMCAGIVSGTLTLIKGELGLTSEEAGRVLSSWLLGMLLGAFAVGYVADRVGARAGWASRCRQGRLGGAGSPSL
ncbi:MAG: hypothetical protein ACO2OQ_05305 [Thermofilaceae archaeon]